MNKISTQDRVAILNILSEGMGINAVARVTGKSKNTVLKLLADVGQACAAYQDRVMVSLPCKRVDCDEIWSFVGASPALSCGERQPESVQGQYVNRGALEPERALGEPSLHSSDQCIQQEAREPHARDQLLLHGLQLREDS